MKLFDKILLGAGVALLASQFAYAAPPKLMVVPDKTWCISKGYVIESERNGKKVVREDYDRALVDSDFKNVAMAIKEIMAERNFPVVDALSQNESDDMDEMFDEAFEGAESGAGVQTDAYDELLKRNRPDITLKVGWNVNTLGSLYNADYTIEAVDTYSNKSVAPVTGQTGEVRRTVPLSVAMKQTAKDNMDNFCGKLQNYFDDLQANGREVSLNVRIVDNGDGTTMSSDFGDQELAQIINQWVSENTVNHQFSRRGSGRNFVSYDQVRIPFFDSYGSPIDAQDWVDGLRTKLRTYGLKAENKSTGLGAARIYIGEK